ncbi:hypothetical protein [Vibrio sp. 10N.261.51.F12]|uniref:hypothetical protein n=1 Tax=Vibrio sp. 10N.261.51.F12 TaxID=3229679 RepID=UPI0035538726
MELTLINTHYDVYIAFALFLLSFWLIFNISKQVLVGTKLGTILYLYHSLFSVVYFGFVSNYGGDVGHYLIKGGVFDGRGFALGTVGLVQLCRLLQDIGISNLGIWILFNLMGAIGLIYVAGSLYSITSKKSFSRRIALVFLFLPSLSFWSAGVGKDAISFLAMALALYSAIYFSKRIHLMIIAILLMLFVRPHMAGMFIIAIVLSSVLQKEIPLLTRLTIGGLGLGVAAILIPFALNYAGVNEDASNLGEYVKGRAQANLHGGGAVDIASMPLPLQMFTYLFRPLPIEARSITQLLASLDNVFLLYLAYLGFKSRSVVRNIVLEGNRHFMWFYVLLAWLILSMTTANLGISVRQKWMFTPMLVYLLLSYIAAREKINSNEK